MAALVAVMSIAVSTADINGLRNLRRIPKSDTSVMLMTFGVTMLTTRAQPGSGGDCRCGPRRNSVQPQGGQGDSGREHRHHSEERRYRVIGQLFFVSKVYFLQGFDLHDHPARITIDLSSAHIWDQSGVAALIR